MRRNPAYAGAIPQCCYTNPRRRKTKKRRAKGHARTVIRTTTSRTKTVTRMNPGLRDPRGKPYCLTFMPSGIGLRGYRGPVNLFSAVDSSDRMKVLKALFPQWNKADHAYAAREHRDAERKYESLWSRTVDKASMATFGRPYQFSDYKISGIGRDEYPERYKKILRMAAQRGSAHATIAHAHDYAAKHLRVGK